MINDIVPDYRFRLYFQHLDNLDENAADNICDISLMRGGGDNLIAVMNTPFEFESYSKSPCREQVFRAIDYDSALFLPPDVDAYIIYANISNDVVSEKHSLSVPNVKNFPHIRNLHLNFIVTYNTLIQNKDTSYEHEILYNVNSFSSHSGVHYSYSVNGSISDSYNVRSIVHSDGSRMLIEEKIYLRLKEAYKLLNHADIRKN